MDIISNFKKIKENVYNINQNAIVIAVSKTFSLDQVQPLINYGHLDYGENKVQEAKDKWSKIIIHNSKLRLHMIGKLQTNKVQDAVKLFNFIHSLDNEKLAFKLSIYEKQLSKKLKYFIQVNFDNDQRKSGISPDRIEQFINYCKLDCNLNIIGFMCIPPLGANPDGFFLRLKNLANEYHLTELSMGMSADYKNAIQLGSTFIRIGSSIFGNRS